MLETTALMSIFTKGKFLSLNCKLRHIWNPDVQNNNLGKNKNRFDYFSLYRKKYVIGSEKPNKHVSFFTADELKMVLKGLQCNSCIG